MGTPRAMTATAAADATMGKPTTGEGMIATAMMTAAESVIDGINLCIISFRRERTDDEIKILLMCENCFS
jgi:hypothetical protein